VVVFEVAMKSRIHLALEYSQPDSQMRRIIWTQCLRAIPASERTIDPEDVIDTLVDESINGREIANAVHTARTLARFEAKTLQLYHIETVLQVRRDFEASVARKKKALEAVEARQRSLVAPNRQNSLLMSSDEPHKWLP
jgi:hypothetical protein